MNTIKITHSSHRDRRPPNRQTGAALITGLILLIVMTMIGVTAMQTTALEERMAGNMRDQNLAFQAAEAGLRDAEALLDPTNLTDRPLTCSTAPCNCTTVSCKVWERNKYVATDFTKQIDSWWTANGQELGTAGTQDIAETVQDPRYVIQELEFKPDELGPPSYNNINPGRQYYRITSRGKGGTDTATAVLETTYTRRF